MRKTFGLFLVVLLSAAMVWAGNSGIDKTEPLMEKVVSKVVDRLDTVLSTSSTINGETIADDTIDDDSIDFSDVTLSDLGVQSGTATNGQVVTFSPVFSARPVLVIEETAGATNTASATVTTSNATFAIIGAGTNYWMALPRN